MSEPELFDQLLSSFPALGGVAREHLALARRELTYPQLAEGEVAYLEGSACPNYLMCLSGRTRVFKASESGREILIYRVGTGGTCVLTTQCLLSGGTFPAASVAETPTRLAALPAPAFRDLMAQSAAFRTFALDDYGRLLSQMFTLIDEVAFSPLDQRLARRLLALTDAHGTASATHQQLANDLGTVREVVSRHLAEWERSGLVRTARGIVRIIDRAALASGRLPGRR